MRRIAVLQFINKICKPAINFAVPNTDVFHASNQVHAIPRGVKLTGTIYDMTCLSDAAVSHSGECAGRDRIITIEFSNARDGLIAISQSAKEDAVRLLDLDASKITSHLPRHTGTFFHSNSRDAQAEIWPSQAFRSFCGDDRAAEECRYAARCVAAVAVSYRQGRIELVFVGPIGWAGNETVNRLRSGIEGVRVLGYVPEEDLAFRYCGRDACLRIHRFMKASVSRSRKRWRPACR